jgi:hypothetical protein
MTFYCYIYMPCYVLRGQIYEDMSMKNIFGKTRVVTTCGIVLKLTGVAKSVINSVTVYSIFFFINIDVG